MPNNSNTSSNNIESFDKFFSVDDIDTLGELGNISTGTSATTLSSLLNHKVVITTPVIKITTLNELYKDFNAPFVATKVKYTQGLDGINLLILRENDAKIIADLMMGGPGEAAEGELSEMHISAVSEAMNQMIGSSSNSLSQIFNKAIDISPPETSIIDLNFDASVFGLDSSERIVTIVFKILVEDLVDSTIMQIIPIEFARELLTNITSAYSDTSEEEPPKKDEPVEEKTKESPKTKSKTLDQQQKSAAPSSKRKSAETPKATAPSYVDVKPASFKTIESDGAETKKSNIELVMDVPLKITVELGQTEKQIRDIMNLFPDSVIELDKKAGEPVDILVNGKVIAKGEVIIIDENLGVKVTELNKNKSKTKK